MSHESLIGRLYGHLTGHASSVATRLLLIVVLAVVAHALVRLIRWVSEWIISRSNSPKGPLGLVAQRPKLMTLHRLVVSSLIFCIYFLAFGLMLQELGVNLAGYLASASILGLALSFGSQGLVQDIVSGLTLILLDTMDVGDMVEIAGAVTVTGRVEEIGLRFTKLVNFYNQRVLIPNRTIANVSRFPRGGVDAYADVWMPTGADRAEIFRLIEGAAKGIWSEFDEIILGEPVIGDFEMPPGGSNVVRVHFKLWPGQGSLIETTYRLRLVKLMKAFDPDYSDWQIVVTYRAAGRSRAAVDSGVKPA
jgi:hypothetical protein